MRISVTCSGCKTRLRILDDRAGTIFACPRCSTAISVPIAGATPFPRSSALPIPAAEDCATPGLKPTPGEFTSEKDGPPDGDREIKLSAERERQKNLKIGLLGAALMAAFLCGFFLLIGAAGNWENDTAAWLAAGCFLTACVPLLILLVGLAEACSSCRLWWASSLYNRELIGEEKQLRRSSVTQTDQHFDSDGRACGSTMRSVPVLVMVVRKTFREHYICRHCGHRWERIRSEEKVQ